MIPTALAVLSLVTADCGQPPPGLSCLAKYYVGKAEWTGAGWGQRLPDGSFLPWKTPPSHEVATPAVLACLPEENGEDEEDDEVPSMPALDGIFRTPYQRGAIQPVVGDDTTEDPGRARTDPLFRATYGESFKEVGHHLSKVRFVGTRYPFHERAAPALARVAARLDALVAEDPTLAAYLKNIGGTWHWRHVAKSSVMSSHAFGIAIDLNVSKSNYWRWQRPKRPLKWKNRLPQNIVDAFEAEGFIWGGRWIHYDTMHFEYRPELLDPACR